jgi:hypothetical protein
LLFIAACVDSVAAPVGSGKFVFVMFTEPVTAGIDDTATVVVGFATFTLKMEFVRLTEPVTTSALWSEARTTGIDVADVCWPWLGTFADSEASVFSVAEPDGRGKATTLTACVSGKFETCVV